MPYSKWSEINNAIKGIKPKVSLSQANLIAKWADAMEGKPDIDSPWAVAIAKFKKDYVSKNGTWAKRAKVKEAEPVAGDGGGKAMGATIGEAAMFTIDGKKYTYDAIREALMGVESAEEIAEYGEAYGALSFADLHAGRAAQEAEDKSRSLLWDFDRIVENIIASPIAQNKPQMIQAAANDLVKLVQEQMSDVTTPSESEPVIEYLDKSAEGVIEEFDFGKIDDFDEVKGVAVNLLEVEGDITPTNPLKLHLALLEPGWGNKKHMNYYRADVLERDAHVFKGADMYVTDHKPGEINERNKVSVVMDSPIGFTEKGAPLAEVGIYDPAFAAKTRNRAALGKLHTLTCSIRAKGTRRRGSVDGVEGYIVESLDKGYGVDWVSSPGAGGHAVGLAETETGGEFMDKEQVTAALAKSGLSEEQQGKLVKIEYADEAALKEAILTESKAGDTPGKPPEKEDSEKGEPEKVAPKEADRTPESVFLSESNVAEILQQTRLPIVSKARIANEKYPTKEALWEAVMAETSYVKELTGSGNPFQHGQSMSEEEDKGKRDATYQEDLARIDKEYELTYMEAPGGE